MTILATLMALVPLVALSVAPVSAASHLPPAIVGDVATLSATPVSHAPGAPTHRVYHQVPGCVQPKSKPTDRVKMTDAQLQADGLPPRSMFPTLAEWQNAVQNETTRACTLWQDQYADGTPVQGYNSSLPATSARLPKNPGDYPYYDQSWSGYDDAGAAHHDAVSGYMNVTCLNSGYWSGHAVSYWVGQGGINGSALLQSGVYIAAYNYTITNDLFVENTGYTGNNGPYDWTTVPCGHTIYVSVSWYYIFEQDQQNGATFNADWGPSVGNGTAEWIVERPSLGLPIPSFQTIHFTHCQFQDQYGIWHSISDDNFIYDHYDTSDGTAFTHQLTTFNSYWYNGPGDSYDAYFKYST